MTDFLKSKAIGFYFVVLALIFGIISLVYLLVWISGYDAADVLIILPLVIAVAADVYLLFRKNNWLLVLAVAGYSVSVGRLLTNSVGSFVDAFQGIAMFGDASQVGTIISISICLLVSILLSIVASFLKQIKNEETGSIMVESSH